MKIKISLKTKVSSNKKIIKVDLYKTEESFLDPTNHLDDCLTSVHLIDSENLESEYSTMISAIEKLINEMLSYTSNSSELEKNN